MFSSNATQVSNVNYIEDVFSTYLYTGNSSTQTITNGIDLSTKGGLVWRQGRSAATGGMLIDTARGIGSYLISYSSDAAQTGSNWIDSFNSNGFTMNSSSFNGGATYASWTFRKQPKFFDVVTYTGNGTNRTIAHNLGSVPGCIIVKDISTSNGYWAVYHRSTGANYFTYLNDTSAASTGSTYWNNTSPTSTVFTVGTNADVNASGVSYVAYVFAHDAGGFGLTGTDNVISCGSYVGNGSTQDITLNYEPQWTIVKAVTTADEWRMYDNMRGVPTGGFDATLWANLSNAESNLSSDRIDYTATGFTVKSSNNIVGETYIYIAIRRGPMKVPTSGTSVYGAETWAGNGASPRTFTSSNWTFPADLVTVKSTDSAAWWNQWSPRLTGGTLSTNDTGAEQSPSTSIAGYVSSFNQTGYTATSGSSSISNYNNGSSSYVSYNIRRAPSFMDVVCYTGNGSTQNISHNLAAVPELMIIKRRDTTGYWPVYSAATGNSSILQIDTTGAVQTGAPQWNSTTPTASVFSLGTSSGANASGGTYVAYLFATCAGVSKVGSYTGTGALQTVNCGFTGGARFVMIKRTDSTGGWFYYDSVRGITSGNDPYLFFNVSDAQVTGTNFVDTDSTGFKVTAAAPAELNANGGTYIFLAIA